MYGHRHGTYSLFDYRYILHIILKWSVICLKVLNLNRLYLILNRLSCNYNTQNSWRKSKFTSCFRVPCLLHMSVCPEIYYIVFYVRRRMRMTRSSVRDNFVTHPSVNLYTQAAAAAMRWMSTTYLPDGIAASLTFASPMTNPSNFDWRWLKSSDQEKPVAKSQQNSRWVLSLYSAVLGKMVPS